MNIKSLKSRHIPDSSEVKYYIIVYCIVMYCVVIYLVWYSLDWFGWIWLGLVRFLFDMVRFSLLGF